MTLKLLIVDDEAPMRQLMRRFLVQDFDLDVREADDGVTALEQLLVEPIDAVILDLRMRIMNGIETLHAIRQSARFSGLPVILVTGQADAESISLALELGVDTIVVKPFTRESLRDRVQSVLSRAARVVVDDTPAVLPLDVGPDQRILLVDRDLAFRELMGPLLGRLATVEDTANEFSALARCLDGPRPDVLVIGDVSELSSIESVARKARHVTAPRTISIVAAVAREAVEATRAGKAFDAVIVRGTEGEAVLRGLIDALAPTAIERLLMHPQSPATAELFDRLRRDLAYLGSVALCDAPVETPSEARGVRAEVDLTGPHAAYELRVFVPFPLALRMAGAKASLKPDMVSDANAIEAVESLLKDGTNQLQAGLARYRYSLEVGPPRVSILDRLGEVAPSVADRAGTRKWLAGSIPHPAVAVLSPRAD